MLAFGLSLSVYYKIDAPLRPEHGHRWKVSVSEIQGLIQVSKIPMIFKRGPQFILEQPISHNVIIYAQQSVESTADLAFQYFPRCRDDIQQCWLKWNTRLTCR